MNTIKIIAFSLIPLLIFILAVSLWTKRIKKNSKIQQRKNLFDGIDLIESIFCGIISFIPVFFFSYLLSGVFVNIKSDYFRIVCNSFILSSFIEEGIRFLVFLLVLIINQNLRYKDQKKSKEEFAFSGILICGVSGFTFGAFENIIYGISSPSIVIIRLVTAVLLHGACGVIIGNAVFQKKGDFSRVNLIQGLLLAWSCHGVYNMFCQLPGLYWISILALVLLIWSTILIFKEQKQNLTF